MLEEFYTFERPAPDKTGVYKGPKIKSLNEGSKTEIRHDPIWDKLKRVWNGGHGLISFAERDTDGVLCINKLFCSKKEIKDIQENLTVPFEMVELGYPDYYSKGLTQMRQK